MKFGRHELDFGRRAFVMGILNVTPDSFSDGGRFFDKKYAMKHARSMVDDGADILDVGGESTRPGSEPVPVEEELKRVIPLIEKISKELDVVVSIDTYTPEVAFKAVEAGACMLNDINGLRTRGMAEFAASQNIPIVVMHMQGSPRNMQENPQYGNVVDDINLFFDERIAFALARGVKKENIILDPGIGFGKRLEHNLEIIKRLGEFKKHGCPLLLGPSRKSFIGQILNLPAGERVEGTIAAVTASVLNGADIVRVHDVKESVRAVKIADAIMGR
ncbi:MAG: dihydropteroate synthase [Candidatus Altiarchaeota archaeon]